MEPGEGFVALNVGGEQFLTTKNTLLSSGSSFFIALFGESFKLVKDSKGRIMIDRSPKKFDVILEYMRTNRLELPVNISRESLMLEAQYYGLDKLALELKGMVETPSSSSKSIRLRYDGCYIKPSGKDCIWFLENGSAYFSYLPVASEHVERVEAQLLGALVSGQFPDEWLDKWSKMALKRQFERHVHIGSYKQKENLLLIEGQMDTALGLVTYRDRILVMESDEKFHIYEFREW